MNKLLRVVYVEPGKKAVIRMIDGSLESMQKTVGGYIEAIRLDDGSYLICNDDGKRLNLPLNRALMNADGQITDIIAGTFFVCGVDGVEFASLNDDTAQNYRKRFLLPEEPLRFGNRFIVHRYDPDAESGVSV